MSLVTTVTLKGALERMQSKETRRIAKYIIIFFTDDLVLVEENKGREGREENLKGRKKREGRRKEDGEAQRWESDGKEVKGKIRHYSG